MEYNIGTVVTLKKGEGRFLKSGGLWVYDNEIASIMGSFVNGDIKLKCKGCGRIVMVPRKTFEKSVKKILQ